MISNIVSFTLSAVDTALSPVGWILSPVSKFLIHRERNLPFSQEEAAPSLEETYQITPLEPTQVETIAFRIFTGLDLEKIRELKCCLSPRISSLADLRNKKGTPEDIRDKIHVYSELSKLNEFFMLKTLESYWVDLNLSTAVVRTLEPINLHIIWEMKKWECSVNTYKVDEEFPLESRLYTRVFIRLLSDEVLKKMERSPDFFVGCHLNYEEKNDSWSWEYIRNQDQSKRERDAASSLRIRLIKDVLNGLSERDTSIHKMKEFHFVKNEGYEKILQARRVLRHLCWLICALSIKYISCFFLPIHKMNNRKRWVLAAIFEVVVSKIKQNNRQQEIFEKIFQSVLYKRVRR